MNGWDGKFSGQFEKIDDETADLEATMKEMQ